MSVGLGYRREMTDWSLSSLSASFFEVCPENWIHRDRARLHEILQTGREIRLHGVSLNLGGDSEISRDFLLQVRTLMRELGTSFYSDHLAASGDAHQLYDLFPIPFTHAQARRVADRIQRVQDTLGFAMAVENSTYYTNVGELQESEFLQTVVQLAGCRILLDLNNVVVNWKNHRWESPCTYVSRIDVSKVSYLHVAGHEFDPRFEMFIDTHSAGVDAQTAQWAMALAEQHSLDVLLEWDNDVPDVATLNQEMLCLRSLTTSVA
ncbi:DUF692 family multinuclear iron-containing protein [Limnohabitans sp. TS-CS-82]|uniref:multinuclear nonheme iron-dependent oxidase n=1 Tax=Limnohabitans sp. TS-CS-82 TaxID=2094193 RepID=UPI001F33AC61|nr:DUF692 family multinuclear iron-containing protein [Limnohabitans sp. TS-CS-82]